MSTITNAMSVDVEDYYQVSAFAPVVARESWDRFPPRVEDNTRRVLDLFAEAGIRATFFVLGCVGERHPALMRAIVDQGHELASHGYAHYRVSEQDRAAFHADAARTKALLEDIGGTLVQGYRAASFSITRETWWALDVLEEVGYRYSSSINPIRHDHYGVPDAPLHAFRPDGLSLLEVPVAAAEFGRGRLPSGGGGYFRLLPYRASRWSLRRINEQARRPAVFYFHPWEIDPDQPPVGPLPACTRFRHYVNLGRMEGKLRRLLADFAWDRMDRIFLPACHEIREAALA